MPYINARFSIGLTDDQKTKIKSCAGQLISLIPNKSEKVLMIEIEDDKTMYHGGKVQPCSFIKVHLYLSAPYANNVEFAEEFVKQVSEITGIEVGNVYLTFEQYNNWLSRGKIK